jgi:hypothetical protein
MNLTQSDRFNSQKCEILDPEDLEYHSSEQYLILCLKICRLIKKNSCRIEDLIDFDFFARSNEISNNQNSIHKNSTLVQSVVQSSPLSPLLLSNLNATECEKYGHKESYKLALFISGMIVCFLIMILNLLTLITIVKSRRLHSLTNILIANLSISDFISGIAFLYPCILNLMTINALETYDSDLYIFTCNIRQHYYLCLVGYSPMITSMLSSMLTLTLLAIEKYIAIVEPYFYERLIHERKYICYVSLFVIWVISILVSLLPLMGWNEQHQNMKLSSYKGFDCRHAQSVPCMFERIFTLDYILMFTVICCICALAMFAIYARIYVIARKQSKKLSKIRSLAINSSSNSNRILSVSLSSNEPRRASNDSETNNGNTFLLEIITFCLTLKCILK